MSDQLSVREMQLFDIHHVVDYWLNADQTYLVGMGVDLNKMPEREDLVAYLTEQISLPYLNKSSYALIWELNQIPVGHCNVDKIDYGNSAALHLHFWNIENRRMRQGTPFLKLSLPYFFKNLKLKSIYSEPFFQNVAPHSVLAQAGFECEQEYITTPGSLNFEQKVKRWVIESEKK
ncbi:MAG: GNAT family N-acetyltransferase [Flavobacteriales bacterium]|nr:GNAT family N-acetyltransferase [Flavobacteriales bacterium]